MKILFLRQNGGFLRQIANLLSQSSFEFSLSVITNGNNIPADSIFENLINPRNSFKTILFYVIKLPHLFIFLFYSFAIMLLEFRQGLKSIKCVLDAFSYVGKIQHTDLTKYDIINIHYISITKAISVLLLPKQTSLVMSFWGSDLFRAGGLCYNFWVRKALKRVETIHISSFEMQTSLLAEFGHELKSKIKFALFVPSFDQINQIDKLSTYPVEQLESFKLKYRIGGKRCIMIGNNGNQGNNHIQILNAIKEIVNKEKITIILPLTYNLDKEYKTKLESYILEQKIDAVLLTEYLPNEDLAGLKVISDIYITMQQTDAMSAFFTESLYAQSICIAASWLPYSTFRQSGAYYIECSEFDKLDQTLENILRDFTIERNNCKKNPSIIKSTFFNKGKLSESWKNIFCTE